MSKKVSANVNKTRFICMYIMQIEMAPLCEMYRLAKLLMRWSDLNIFHKYQFRIVGCSLKVRVFRTFLVCWENIEMTNEAWGSNPHPPNRNMEPGLTFDGIVKPKHICITGFRMMNYKLYKTIKPFIAPKMAHFHKNVRVCSITLLQSFQIDTESL